MNPALRPTTRPRMPMARRARIACIGEAMVELSLGPETTASPALSFAGDSLNTGIYLKRILGDEAEVGFVTALGTDPLSDRMIEFMASESVSTNHIARLPDKLPGLYAITTDSEGERSFLYWRNDSAAKKLFQEPEEHNPSDNDPFNFAILEYYNVLYLTAITLAILPAPGRLAFLDWLRAYKKITGATVVFDSNYRPALWESKQAARELISAAWQVCDIALPSLDDELALFEDNSESDVINRLHSYGIERGVLKRGANGPLALAESGSTADLYPELENPVVTVVDSTAAGDSFNAGYLSVALTGGTEVDAMLAGHHCAVKVIQHHGAIVPIANW